MKYIVKPIIVLGELVIGPGCYNKVNIINTGAVLLRQSIYRVRLLSYTTLILQVTVFTPTGIRGKLTTPGHQLKWVIGVDTQTIALFSAILLLAVNLQLNVLKTLSWKCYIIISCQPSAECFQNFMLEKDIACRNP